METIKRWISLFVFATCVAGLAACATSPTIPATTAPAPTSTAMAVPPTDTLRPTETPGLTPTLGLTTGFDDVPMVKVPAGNFIMGSTGEEIAHAEQIARPYASAYNDFAHDEWPQMIVNFNTFANFQKGILRPNILR